MLFTVLQTQILTGNGADSAIIYRIFGVWCHLAISEKTCVFNSLKRNLRQIYTHFIFLSISLSTKRPLRGGYYLRIIVWKKKIRSEDDLAASRCNWSQGKNKGPSVIIDTRLSASGSNKLDSRIPDDVSRVRILRNFK